MEFQSTTQAAQKMTNFLKGMSDDMQICIQNCNQCAQVCEQLIQHCLNKGGMHAAPKHIRTLQDCADACLVSAKFMIRQSDLHPRTCAVCADTCIACAVECERMSDDEMMKFCADVCRRCADTCQRMSTH